MQEGPLVRPGHSFFSSASQPGVRGGVPNEGLTASVVVVVTAKRMDANNMLTEIYASASNQMRKLGTFPQGEEDMGR